MGFSAKSTDPGTPGGPGGPGGPGNPGWFMNPEKDELDYRNVENIKTPKVSHEIEKRSR